jgi:adenylate kinase
VPRGALNVLILGPPGSGKGTQSQRLSRALAIPHISTGDLLRDAISRDTPLGQSVSECVAAGHLVPDALINAAVRSRLEGADTRTDGFLLDGFPRNIEQFDALLGWITPRRIDAAVELVVPDAVVGQRLAERGRADDVAPFIQERLDAFRRVTVPLLRHLDSRGLLVSVDADRPVDAVADAVIGCFPT